MATATRSQLILATLDKLGVIASGQTPSTEDTNKVDGYLDAILRELAAMEFVAVPDTNNVPLEWLQSLADYVADRSKMQFSVTADEDTRLSQAATIALDRLKVMTRGRPTYELQRGEFF